MSSVHHGFLGAVGRRCARKMPDGSACERLEASHLKDDRNGDRHLCKDDRHASQKDRHKNRPEKTGQIFVFFDTEGKDFPVDEGPSTLGPVRLLLTEKDRCKEQSCLLKLGHEGAHDDGECRWRIEHRLIYGAAVDETGKLLFEVDSEDGKSQPPPEAWLDALLEIGRRSKQRSCFAYGFGYDRTMMLKGLPAEVLYMLTRRDERPLTTPKRGQKPRAIPLYWNDFQLDLQGTRFSIAKLRRLPDGRPMKNAKGRRMYWRMTVWDVLKFFQCPFVDALDSWRWKGDQVSKKTGKPAPENLESELIVPDEDLERMRMMKGKRDEFDKMEWTDVKVYCQSECKFGALLVRELVTACERIGVKLRRFDGAGSISDALMQNNEMSQYMSAKSVDVWINDSVKHRRLMKAVMCAFAGGRFETAYCGIQRGKIYTKDIASAYPYAMYLHPCLAHGKWEHIGDGNHAVRDIDARIERADLALLKVKVIGRDKGQAFGSLHNRDKEGNITFPIDNLTWTWKPEYLAARDGMKDRLTVRETFLYHTDCTCHPFKFMAKLYLERLRIGKEGRGTAMKLGYNGCAGKTMQKVGSHRWQEYIWAGNTTSRTRSQLLWGISKFPSQWDVCYLATDSIFAMKDVELDKPEFTGTGEALKYDKPELGAWESGKHVYDGMCFVRPGIAFPLNATEEQLKEIKARGISKSVLLKNVSTVVDLMRSQKVIGGESDVVQLSRRIFAGMKMCVTKHGKPVEYSATARYGQWFEQDIKIKVEAKPKRFCRLPGEDGMLLPHPEKSESLAYGSTKVSEDARALQEMQDILLEQPNLDMSDYYGGDE